MKRWFEVVLIITVILISCADKDMTIDEDRLKEIIKPRESLNIELNDVEKEYLKSIKNGKGFLNIATRGFPILNKDNTEITHKEEAYNGFSYKMIKEFERFVKIPVKIGYVSYTEYYEKDGSIPEDIVNVEYSYTPDLFNDVDVYADFIIKTEWKENLMDFVKIAPVNQVFVTRKRKTIADVEELKHKIIAVKPYSHSINAFTRLESEFGEELDYIYKDSDIALLGSVAEVWDSDIILIDSATVVRYVGTIYETLGSCISFSEFMDAGWCVEEGNDILRSIIRKFIFYTHKEGIFDKYWKNEFYYSYPVYLQMIGM